MPHTYIYMYVGEYLQLLLKLWKINVNKNINRTATSGCNFKLKKVLSRGEARRDGDTPVLYNAYSKVEFEIHAHTHAQ